MLYWLNDIHFDLTLDSLQIQYPHVKILTLGMQGQCQIGINGYELMFENTKYLIMIINNHNHWVTALKIDTERSSVQISLVNTPVFLYDSFNDLSNLNSLE